ncbi:MAG: hypothetical protein R3B96_02925 [Pirellulaceae bacterium]
MGEAAVARPSPPQLAEILMKQSAMAGSLSDSLLATGVVDDGTLSRNDDVFSPRTWISRVRVYVGP